MSVAAVLDIWFTFISQIVWVSPLSATFANSLSSTGWPGSSHGPGHAASTKPSLMGLCQAPKQTFIESK